VRLFSASRLKRAAIAAAAILLLTLPPAPATERPHPHPAPAPRPHGGVPGLDFLGLMLGIFGGLGREQPQPGCDVGYLAGWSRYTHSPLGHAISVPNHWRNEQGRTTAEIPSIFLNACPPGAAVLVARMPADRLLDHAELGQVALALRRQGGGMFQSIVHQEPVAAQPGQTRLAAVYAGHDGGAAVAGIVHFVSTGAELYLAMGMAPRAGGERLGGLLRESVAGFTAPVRQTPPPAAVAALDLTGAWIELTAPSGDGHLVVIAQKGNGLTLSGTYRVSQGAATWFATGELAGRQVSAAYRFDPNGAAPRGAGALTLAASADGTMLEGIERGDTGERRVRFVRASGP
jgi:hypothetical protein